MTSVKDISSVVVHQAVKAKALPIAISLNMGQDLLLFNVRIPRHGSRGHQIVLLFLHGQIRLLSRRSLFHGHQSSLCRHLHSCTRAHRRDWGYILYRRRHLAEIVVVSRTPPIPAEFSDWLLP